MNTRYATIEGGAEWDRYDMHVFDFANSIKGTQHDWTL